MPVEASDIAPTAMNTGDNNSTGCEEAVSGSDDLVRKMTERARESLLSNQIHNAKHACWRKAWKTRTESYCKRYKDRLRAGRCFPQLKEDCSGKRAIDIPDAQQRAAVPDWLKPDVVCGGRSRIANALHFVFDRPSARFLCAICRGAGRLCPARRR